MSCLYRSFCVEDYFGNMRKYHIVTFSNIQKRRTGLGPAIVFFYSGPPINIIAIILAAHILWLEMVSARTICAFACSTIIGVIMSFIYRKEEKQKRQEQMQVKPIPE